MPSDLIGCAASSSAVTKPMKSPTVLMPAGDAPVGEGDDAGDGDAGQRLQSAGPCGRARARPSSAAGRSARNCR